MDASKVAVDLEYRQKGLLWNSTCKVDFDGTYEVSNLESDKRLV